MPPCNGPARGPFPGQPVLLYLRMVPVWVFVDEVRHFVESFCACARIGPEREGQLALATHELMQNAITNGTSADIELRLAIDAAADWVEVSLTNTCAPGQADRLRARVAKLQEAEPLTSYVAAMSADPRAPGGLGLARIRYEAQLELDVFETGDRLTVSAKGKLNPAQLSAATGVGHG
jgi:hypothetical protein